MSTASRDDTIPALRGWSPQVTLAGYFPAIAELCRTILPEIRAIEQQLDREEAAGGDTVRTRQSIGELQWRLQYTGDAAAAAKTFERVRALAVEPLLAGSSRDEQGSFGIGTDVWFLKLDASVDPMLAEDFDIGDNPPRFLDRINDPNRLRDYLAGLVVSRLAQDGVDRRKELNFATADLVRLIRAAARQVIRGIRGSRGRSMTSSPVGRTQRPGFLAPITRLTGSAGVLPISA